MFHRDFGLPSKWHYNVFHAISLFENEYNGGIESKKTEIKRGQTSLTQTFGFTKQSSRVIFVNLFFFREIISVNFADFYEFL